MGQSESPADIDFQARIYGVYTPRCQVQLNGPEATTGSYVANFQVEFVSRARPDDFRKRETSIGYVIVLMDPGGAKVSQDVRKIRLRITPDKAKNSEIDTLDVVLPLKNRESADDYRFYVSLDLTDEEREYGRRNPQHWP